MRSLPPFLGTITIGDTQSEITGKMRSSFNNSETYSATNALYTSLYKRYYFYFTGLAPFLRTMTCFKILVALYFPLKPNKCR